jgi:hypothetical protein
VIEVPQRHPLVRGSRTFVVDVGGDDWGLAGPGSLDFPAFGSGLWALYDSTGLRPEYVLPVLYSESGFSTTITNSIGCIGINQACPFAWTIPSDYASYSASQQLASVVAPMFKANIAKSGPINSGTRAYQSNFLPATMDGTAGWTAARSLDDVVVSKSGPTNQNAADYNGNIGLDVARKGYITVADLAHFIAKAAASSAVKSAIAQTYALRPGESPQDPVYGTDFSSSSPGSGITFSEIIALGAAGVTAIFLGQWAADGFRRPKMGRANFWPRRAR